MAQVLGGPHARRPSPMKIKSKSSPVSRAVLALFLVAAVIVACVVTWRYKHPSTPYRNVAIIGDSITWVSSTTTHVRLDRDFAVHDSGVNGARADERLGDLGPLVAARPNQLVVNLGTNDVIQQTSPDQTISALARIASSFPETRCVHLVTVRQNILNFADADVDKRSAILNDRIHDLAAQRGWDVIEWDAIVGDYEAQHEPQGPISYDSVHPNPAGQQMLADAYREALERCGRFPF